MSISRRRQVLLSGLAICGLLIGAVAFYLVRESRLSAEANSGSYVVFIEDIRKGDDPSKSVKQLAKISKRIFGWPAGQFYLDVFLSILENPKPYYDAVDRGVPHAQEMIDQSFFYGVVAHEEKIGPIPAKVVNQLRELVPNLEKQGAPNPAILKRFADLSQKSLREIDERNGASKGTQPP